MWHHIVIFFIFNSCADQEFDSHLHKWHFFFGWEDHFNNLLDGPNNFSSYTSKFVLLTFGLLELTKLPIFIYVNCNWRIVVSSTIFIFFTFLYFLTHQIENALTSQRATKNKLLLLLFHFCRLSQFSPSNKYWWKNQLMYKAKSQQSLKTQKRENCTTAKHMNPIFLFFLFIHFMLCFWIKICFSNSKCRGDFESLME